MYELLSCTILFQKANNTFSDFGRSRAKKGPDSTNLHQKCIKNITSGRTCSSQYLGIFETTFQLVYLIMSLRGHTLYELVAAASLIYLLQQLTAGSSIYGPILQHTPKTTHDNFSWQDIYYMYQSISFYEGLWRTERTCGLCCTCEKVKYPKNCYKTYRWAFVAEDVFSVDLCTLVQRIARVNRQFTLQLLAAAICPRGAHLQSEYITRTSEHSSKWGRKRKYYFQEIRLHK